MKHGGLVSLARRMAAGGTSSAGGHVLRISPVGRLQQKTSYHASSRRESAIVIGGIAVAVAAAGAQYAIAAYKNMPQASAPPQAEGEDSANAAKSSSAADDATAASRVRARAQQQQQQQQQAQKQQQQQTQAQDEPVTSFDKSMQEVFAPFGGNWLEFKKTFFAKNFYDGGFEDKMTKREAALVLGVRENTSVERIKEAHRRVLLLNHPDRGGSAYIAAKVNEAKDLLLKGRDRT